MVQALNEIRTDNATGPSDVSLGLIAASGDAGIYVKGELCQRVLDGFGMPVEWALSMVVPFFIGKDDIRN